MGLGEKQQRLDSMNKKSIQHQIHRLYGDIDAHLVAIQQKREQIERLKKMEGQEKPPQKKKTGIGISVVADRMARITGQMSA